MPQGLQTVSGKHRVARMPLLENSSGFQKRQPCLPGARTCMKELNVAEGNRQKLWPARNQSSTTWNVRRTPRLQACWLARPHPAQTCTCPVQSAEEGHYLCRMHHLHQ